MEDYYFEYVLEKRTIPKGYVKCPQCHGKGEIRKYYGPSWDKGQFETCYICHGKKIMKIEEWEEWTKIGKYRRIPYKGEIT